MPKATHTIGFRHFTFGKWREPGTPVDATTWPNRQDLEKAGYLKPVPSDVDLEAPEEVEVEEQLDELELEREPEPLEAPAAVVEPPAPPAEPVRPVRRPRR